MPSPSYLCRSCGRGLNRDQIDAHRSTCCQCREREAASQSEAVAPERGTDLTNLAARLAATPAPVVPDSTEPGGEG
jgi:hypothetical protein